MSKDIRVRLTPEKIEERKRRSAEKIAQRDAALQREKELNRPQRALEFRKTLQMFLSTLDPEIMMTSMLEVPSVFPKYKVGYAYKTKDIFSYGKNSVGDPQLYQVLQDHTSAEEWKPDASPSLYKPCGITADGYPEWVQPLGASDAYNIGDIVDYKGTLYKSIIDANVWAPDVYPAGWEEVNGTVQEVE